MFLLIALTNLFVLLSIFWIKFVVIFRKLMYNYIRINEVFLTWIQIQIIIIILE